MSAPPIEPDLFERYGLLPTMEGGAITAALAACAEEVPPDERPAVRAAWEALSRRPEERVARALEALPLPPPPGEPPRPAAPPPPLRLALGDLVPYVALGRHLPPPSAAERELDRPSTEDVCP